MAFVFVEEWWLTGVHENKPLPYGWRREVRAEKVTARPGKIDWLWTIHLKIQTFNIFKIFEIIIGKY
jgi:hypothetical protein